MDKMNLEFTRDQRMLLWNLIGAEIHKLESQYDELLESYIDDKIKRLKVLEILIVG
jgi:hypothetical protein